MLEVFGMTDALGNVGFHANQRVTGPAPRFRRNAIDFTAASVSSPPLTRQPAAPQSPMSARSRFSPILAQRRTGWGTERTPGVPGRMDHSICIAPCARGSHPTGQWAPIGGRWSPGGNKELGHLDDVGKVEPLEGRLHPTFPARAGDQLGHVRRCVPNHRPRLSVSSWAPREFDDRTRGDLTDRHPATFLTSPPLWAGCSQYIVVPGWRKADAPAMTIARSTPDPMPVRQMAVRVL